MSKCAEIAANKHRLHTSGLKKANMAAFLTAILYKQRERRLMKPLLKWPGGKRHSVSLIRCHIPTTYNRYFEPFCGGAALFFALEPEQSVISDLNIELVNCYRAISQNADQVITALSQMRNSEFGMCQGL